MNECFTNPIFRNFSIERKRQTREGVQKRKEGSLRQRLVIQQAVTCKLLNNTI